MTILEPMIKRASPPSPSLERVLIVTNRRSGTGNRDGIGRTLAKQIAQSGRPVELISAGPELTDIEFARVLRDTRVVVVVGGDGTIHHALPQILQSKASVYHVPRGTENLFAREFGMTRSIPRLLNALEHGTHEVCDIGECDGRPFALMCSVGFDACVVERVAAARRGGVSRIDYVRQAAAEMLEPRVPELTITVDGTPLVTRQRGLCVVANSRQYAARLNPARRASMSDGVLDVVFYTHATRVGLAAWLIKTAAGLHEDDPRLLSARGRQITIASDQAHPFQLDGESVAKPGAGPWSLEIQTRPGALRVLRPRD